MLKFAALFPAAALLASPAHAGDRVSSVELERRVDVGSFEFRGSGRTARGFENVIWRFQREGRVVSEGSLSRLFYLGGMGEEFGIRASGTWRREGDKVCVSWDPFNRRFDGCYGVMLGRGNIVHLTGPQFMDGGLNRHELPPSSTAASQTCAMNLGPLSSAPGPVARSCVSRPR
jgi:hypothetical protein